MAGTGEDEVRHIVILNQNGSVEHYFHFLLGFLLPLANFMNTLRGDAETMTLLVRSCGPMDRMLAEVGFPGLTVIPREEHARLASATQIGGRPLQRNVLYGLDFSADGDYPPAAIFRHAVGVLRKRLAPVVAAHTERLNAVFAPGATRILLIDRGSNSYYSEPQAENAGSGAERRSIGNFHAMHRTLQSTVGNSLAVVLENTSLSEQIALFSTADVVIAQHGAALANVVWCKPGTRVMEIAPAGYRVNCFPPLSRMMGLQHLLVPQAGLRGDCDVEALMKAVRAAAASQPSSTRGL